MILLFGSIKGGVGKTTLATNILYLRSKEKKRKMLLIDTDEQESATEWHEQRTYRDIPVHWDCKFFTTEDFHKLVETGGIDKLKEYYEDIIIDTAGRLCKAQRCALTVADKFLVPFRPSFFDVNTLRHINTLLSEALKVNSKLQTFAVINQADSKGTDNCDARNQISECPYLKCLPFHIGTRKSFRSSSSMGLAVCELEKKYKDKKANDEINMLYDALYK